MRIRILLLRRASRAAPAGAPGAHRDLLEDGHGHEPLNPSLRRLRRHPGEVERARSGRHGVDALAQFGRSASAASAVERILQKKTSLRHAAIPWSAGAASMISTISSRDLITTSSGIPNQLEHRLDRGFQFRPILAAARNSTLPLSIGADIPSGAERSGEVRHADHVLAPDIDAAQQRHERGVAAPHATDVFRTAAVIDTGLPNAESFGRCGHGDDVERLRVSGGLRAPLLNWSITLRVTGRSSSGEKGNIMALNTSLIAIITRRHPQSGRSSVRARRRHPQPRRGGRPQPPTAPAGLPVRAAVGRQVVQTLDGSPAEDRIRAR